MDANKMISVLGGMIYASDNHPKSSEWMKEFLIELKTIIEEQQKTIEGLTNEHFDTLVYLSTLKNVEEIHKAIKDMVEDN